MTDRNVADSSNLAFAKVLDIVVAQEIFLGKLIQFGLIQYTITED